MKVFLGGTCNGSQWRELLIPMLEIGYFNPVVEDWTPECQAEEIKQREECDIVLYGFTPLMKGVYAIAEVADDSNKRPGKTIFFFAHIEENGVMYGKEKLNSLKAVARLVERNGGKVFDNVFTLAQYLNSLNL